MEIRENKFSFEKHKSLAGTLGGASVGQGHSHGGGHGHSHGGVECKGHQGHRGHQGHSPRGHSVGGHSHGGVECQGHHNQSHTSSGSSDSSTSDFNLQIQKYSKWIFMDPTSALGNLKETGNRMIAAAISEILRMGPKPDHIHFPPAHPFEYGASVVFEAQDAVAILVECSQKSSVAALEGFGGDVMKRHGFEFDTLVYLEAILDLLYMIYDQVPEEAQETETKYVVVDQFLRAGGIEMLRSRAFAHHLAPFVPAIGEMVEAITMLLKSINVYCCKCDGIDQEGGKCGKKEERVGEFKACAKCRIDVYCGRECQVGAWKTHKLICGKVPTLPKTAEQLLMDALSVKPNPVNCSDHSHSHSHEHSHDSHSGHNPNPNPKQCR